MACLDCCLFDSCIESLFVRCPAVSYRCLWSFDDYASVVNGRSVLLIG